ncbi:MAG: peptidylprolyl isomerase [Bacteroidales bacterium]|jgi:Peptidyl-prolyl cis-trans isomerase (rotamase) - cyclophilin family|nr:peptidylprolyl isomerase [Bacteroidales bacterium]
MKHRILYLFLAAAVAIAGCKGGRTQEPAPVEPAEETQQITEEKSQEIEPMNEKPAAPADKWALLGDEPMLKIRTSDGTMTVRLYSETPLHRDNFIKLSKSGFYDGLLFHRVIKGFMIQGGDPLTRDTSKVALYGTGGPGYTIPAEIVAGKTHKKGALAAARRGDMVNPAKESSGSQFYIVQDPDNCVHLDGEYTIFGEVVDGLDVIDKIASRRTGQNDRPVGDVRIISITPAE